MITLPTIEMEAKSKKGERNDVLEDHYYVFADSETTTEKNLEVEGKVRTVVVGGITWGINEQEYIETDTMFGFLQRVLSTFNKWKYTTRKALHPKNWKPCCVIYFHNLKFDNSFLLSELYQQSGTIISMNEMRKQRWMLDKLAALKISKYDKIDTITKKLSKIKRSVKIELEGKEYSTDRASDIKEYVEKMTWSQAVLATEMGTWYYAQVVTPSLDMLEIRDSAKLFPLPISKLGESVGIKKLNDEKEKDWDYKKYREIGYKLNERERQYFLHDIEILAKLMSEFLEKQTNLYLTRSRYAYEQLKINVDNQVIKLSTGKVLDESQTSKFGELFPPTESQERSVIQRAYKGGVVYTYQHEAKKGLVYDVNSEYPANMAKHDYPVGAGIPGRGKYQLDKKHPWFIQFFTAKFKLKKEIWATPFINGKFSKNGKVVRSSDDLLDCFTVLGMSCTDFLQFLIHYDVTEINYVSYVKYATAHKPFEKFILKNYLAKQEATEKMAIAKKNGENWHIYEAPRQEAKLTMNGCYGYFAKRIINAIIKTVIDADGKIKNETEAFELGEGNNLAVAIAITSYAREQLLNAVRAAGNRILYTDTDSIHVKGWEPIQAENFEVDQSALGAWKIESKFVKAKYLRKKTYVEETLKDSDDENSETYMLVKFAGLDSESKKANIKCVEDLDYRTYSGVKVARRVNGGVLIDDTATKTIVRTDYTNKLDYASIKPGIRTAIKKYYQNILKLEKLTDKITEDGVTVEEYNEVTADMEIAPESILKYARNSIEQYNYAVTLGKSWDVNDKKKAGKFGMTARRQVMTAEDLLTIAAKEL